jgi:hypothetical protein
MEPDFYGRSGSEYLPLIESFGEVLLNCDLGKYSGDTFALVRAGTRVGILIFGWGSCAGCDALASCETWEDVAALRYDIARGIRWFMSAAEALAYIQQHDWTLEWSWKMVKSRRKKTGVWIHTPPSWHAYDCKPHEAPDLFEQMQAVLKQYIAVSDKASTISIASGEAA